MGMWSRLVQSELRFLFVGKEEVHPPPPFPSSSLSSNMKEKAYSAAWVAILQPKLFLSWCVVNLRGNIGKALSTVPGP